MSSLTSTHVELSLISLGVDNRNKKVALLAIYYFCMSADAEGDFASPIGFDDDRTVLMSAMEWIGLSKLAKEKR